MNIHPEINIGYNEIILCAQNMLIVIDSIVHIKIVKSYSLISYIFLRLNFIVET